MNTESQQSLVLDDEEWEATDNDPVENQLAAQAFAVALGLSIEESPIKPNHWLDKN